MDVQFISGGYHATPLRNFHRIQSRHQNVNGRRTVTTADFVAELAKFNHQFTLREANRWTEFYQSSFRDISTEEGEKRTFFLYNPNAGF